MTREIVTDGLYIPEDIKELEYWVIWDFTVKQPRAPWVTGHCYPCEWRQDSDINPRTDYSQAHATATLDPTFLHSCFPFPDGPPERVGPTILLPHEGEDTPGPEPESPPILFIDYDDVILEGHIPQEVWDTAAAIGGPLFVSRSFLDPTSDTAGLHQLARGTLPGALHCIPKTEFETRGHIEVYYRSRMTGFTWQHVRGSPTDPLPDATEAIATLIETYGTEQTQRRATTDPNDYSHPHRDVSKPVTFDGDSTDDIEHVFRAIQNVTARDIRLQSTVTEETGARKSYNPSWETSDSGTRLGYDKINGEEVWIYRAANHPVDALQVVAREEGIINDVTTYPQGEAFWQAVQALRERGATIPYYEGDDGTHPDVLQLHATTDNTEDKQRRAVRALRASQRS